MVLLLVSIQLLFSMEVRAELLDSRISCGDRLQNMAAPNKPVSITEIESASRNKDQQFIEYLHAIIYVESRYSTTAVSHVGASGLMQLTAPAVSDAAQFCALPLRPKNLQGVRTNVQYGSCYLMRLLQYTEGNYTEALIIYNGGFLALTKYRAGQPLHIETANYVLQVTRMRQMCNDSIQLLTH